MRNEILDQLLQDMHLITFGEYDSDIAEVKRGAHLPDGVSNFPFVCFMCNSDLLEEQAMGRRQHRILEVAVYGYAKTTEDEYESLYDLLSSVETFLASTDWTYHQTTLTQDIELWEGGAVESISAFKLNIEIHYVKE